MKATGSARYVQRLLPESDAKALLWPLKTKFFQMMPPVTLFAGVRWLVAASILFLVVACGETSPSSSSSATTAQADSAAEAQKLTTQPAPSGFGATADLNEIFGEGTGDANADAWLNEYAAFVEDYMALRAQYADDREALQGAPELKELQTRGDDLAQRAQTLNDALTGEAKAAFTEKRQAMQDYLARAMMSA